MARFFDGRARAAGRVRLRDLVSLADAKTEAHEIGRFGGKAQKNSGRGATDKGDATLGPFLVDVKEYNKSYAISVDNWAKICSDAVKAGRLQPALNLVMGPVGQKVRVWVISDRMFKEMYDAWEEKYNG
jgi:hypothetical protein